MSAETIRATLYRGLKTYGPLPATKLPDYLDLTPSQVNAMVKDQVARGLLEITPQGNVRVLRPLNPPSFDLEDIKAITKTPQEAEKPPAPLEQYQNPLIYHLPALEQGDPQSCVGHAAAVLAFLSHIRVTPTDTPIKGSHIVRNMIHKSRGFRYDWMFRPIPSPWWIYKAARKIGRMGASTQGARTADAIEVLQRLGVVSWSSCLTPKTLPDPGYWSLACKESFDSLSIVGTEYQVESMGIARGFDQVCDLIQQSGAVQMDIAIFPSITRMGPDGRIPLPKDGEAKMGNHSMVFHGFDRKARTLTYDNWWRGFPRRGILSAAYVNQHAGPALAIWDNQDPPMPEDPQPLQNVYLPQESSPGSWWEHLKNTLRGR
jgi:hypothetical protein